MWSVTISRKANALLRWQEGTRPVLQVSSVLALLILGSTVESEDGGFLLSRLDAVDLGKKGGGKEQTVEERC